ncbi:MAG TPA: twin-arginine translocase subunit TatC [Acidimicrobiales bacterium]|jgi:sec-independent protein translocase protein TatC|nr:twin-arginine translocase subunit TatC [Acidimicrobiales bacterium]
MAITEEAATGRRAASAKGTAPDQMTLFEHLGELRRRVIICAIAIVICAVVTYVIYPHILNFLLEPYCRVAQGKCFLYAQGPLDAFAIRLDVTAYGAVAIALPVIVFQLWRFVTPGLKANEKKYAIPFSIAAFGLFVLGAVIAWITFPHALQFLHAAGGRQIQQIFSPQKYLNLVGALVLIFGLTFEFPVVLVGLQLARVITPAALSRARRVAIVLIVITAGVITPSSDPFSMLALAVPMLLFYELSIIIGRTINARR